MTHAFRCFSLAVVAFVSFSTTACDRKGAPATVLRLEPDNGTTSGGDQITIIGSGFEPGQTTAEVRFGRRRAEGVVIGSTSTINVTTPAGDRGPSEVTVILNNGMAFSVPNGFRYVEPQDASKVREAYLKTTQKK